MNVVAIVRFEKHFYYKEAGEGKKVQIKIDE